MQRGKKKAMSTSLGGQDFGASHCCSLSGGGMVEAVAQRRKWAEVEMKLRPKM
jgi:hypothetical protein